MAAGNSPLLSRAGDRRGEGWHCSPSAGAAFLFLFMLLAGLTPFPAWTGESQTVIRLWDMHVHDKKFRQGIFKEFNKANPEIKVEYTSQVTTAYATVMDAAFRSGNAPEMFVTGGLPVSLAKLVEMGWISPLDDLAPSQEAFRGWADKFPKERQPFLENANVLKGKTYSWPTSGEAGRLMFFWNTKLFREAGLKDASGIPAVPETWGDVRQFAKKITELGQGKVYGIVHGIKNSGVWDIDLFNSIAVSAGWPRMEVPGSPMNAGFDLRTGHWDYRHPALRGSIQLWFDMKSDGSIFPGDLSMDDEQSKFKFTQDLAGMIFGGWWNPGGFLAINEALEFDVVLPPIPERGMRKGYSAATPLARNSEYVVSSKVASKAAAWKVVEFMTSETYQVAWVKAGGGISAFPEYNKTEYFPHATVAKASQMGVTGKRIAPQMPEGALKVEELLVRPRPDYDELMQGMWIGRLGWEVWDDFQDKMEKAFDAALIEARKYGVNLTRADYTFPDWDPTKDYIPKKK